MIFSSWLVDSKNIKLCIWRADYISIWHNFSVEANRFENAHFIPEKNNQQFKKKIYSQFIWTKLQIMWNDIVDYDRKHRLK